MTAKPVLQRRGGLKPRLAAMLVPGTVGVVK